MGLDFLKILDILKLPLKSWFIICVFSGMLLFIPKSYLEFLNLKNIIEEYKSYIGIIFLFAITIIMINLFNDFFRKTQNKKMREEKINRSIKELDNLSIYEASILLYCYANNQRTVILLLDNGYVTALVDKYYLKRIGHQGQLLRWPYTVQEHIWDYIPTLIEKFDLYEVDRIFKKIQNPYSF